MRLCLHLAGRHDGLRIVDHHGNAVFWQQGTPIADRGLFFARLAPHRVLLHGIRRAGDITGSMFISVDSPTVSAGNAPTATGDKLNRRWRRSPVRAVQRAHEGDR